MGDLFGVNILTGVSIFYIYLSKGRVSSPFYIVGIYSLLYLCCKFYWNQYWKVNFLLGCSSSEISQVCGTLAVALFFAGVLARGLIVLIHPQLLKLDYQLNSGPVESCCFVWAQSNKMFVYILVGGIFMVVGWARFFERVDVLNDSLSMRRLLQGNGSAYIMIVINLLISMTAVFVSFDIFEDKNLLRRWLVPLGVSCAYSIFSGFASSILMIFVTLMSSISLRKRLRLWWGPLLAFPVIVIFAFIHNVVRQAKSYDPSASIASIIQNAENIGDVAPEMFNRLDYLEMLTSGYNLLVTREAEGISPLIEVLVQPIPRSIWPEKPMNFSTSMSWQVIPEVVLGMGSTANFSALNEFVRAGGQFFGPLMFVSFLAVVLACAEFFHIHAQSDPHRALYYFCVLQPYLSIGLIAGYVNDLALPCLLISLVVVSLLERFGIIPPNPKRARGRNNVISGESKATTSQRRRALV